MFVPVRGLAAALLFLSAAAGHAATITTNSFSSSASYDFNATAGSFTAGPEVRAIGGQSFTWTSTNSSSVIDYQSTYGLADNGRWTSGRSGYAGLNNDTGIMTITFDELVRGVGGLINYSTYASSSFSDVVLSIFGDGGVLLETFNLTTSAPISTPGADDAGAFRGFSRAGADIRALTLTGAYVVIDDLTIDTSSSPSQVPLPAAGWLLIGGLAGLSALRRRQRDAG